MRSPRFACFPPPRKSPHCELRVFKILLAALAAVTGTRSRPRIPLFVSAIRFCYYPARAYFFLQAICDCGKSSLEALSVKEELKWRTELEQNALDQKQDTAAVSAKSIEPSAAYRAFANAGCSEQFLKEYGDVLLYCLEHIELTTCQVLACAAAARHKNRNTSRWATDHS
jgi:hypothetical protein